ncbi:unnamed protein product [Miscanthus lutarioriparius]|uniref:Uncharacterized protein n=1 Tax=Miscanthus lutarioriparius TaxID=422564 RepID=A0A811MXD7_9POAL|nr:unnamed protein product [Miscanthus lutarioriparius]
MAQFTEHSTSTICRTQCFQLQQPPCSQSKLDGLHAPRQLELDFADRGRVLQGSSTTQLAHGKPASATVRCQQARRRAPPRRLTGRCGIRNEDTRAPREEEEKGGRRMCSRERRRRRGRTECGDGGG